MKKLVILIVLIISTNLTNAQFILLDKHVYSPGERIIVSFTSERDLPSDSWIGIIPSSVPHGSEAVNDKYDISYQYLKNGTRGTYIFTAPEKVGNYDFRCHDTDNGKEIMQRFFEVSNLTEQEYSPTQAVYKTSFNEMILYINGTHITGTYKHSGGKIDGTLVGNKLTGTWTQTNAKGRMEFTFNSNYSAFTGKWGYNNDEPSKEWNGTIISGISNPSTTTKVSPKSNNSSNSKIAGVYKTSFSEMILYINGTHVTGTYKHSGGKIDGTLVGNKLTGTWTQTNGKGRIEFTFNSNFSAFTGKWGYNNDVPSKEWKGYK